MRTTFVLPCTLTTTFLTSILATLLWFINADCVVDENSRALIPFCNLKEVFPDLEAPHLDNFRDLFRLSGTSLEVLQSLDREQLITTDKCDPVKRKSFNSVDQCVLVLEFSGAGPRFYQLPVLVADVNDNTPSFDRPVFDIRIPENSALNVEVDLPHARDPDRGRNGTVSYSLQKGPGSHKFVLLNPTPNGQSESQLKLKILQAFDREVEEELQLIVVAKDQGEPTRSMSLIVKIEITDVNDHTPEFNQSTYRFTVPESISQGQPIGRVYASDRDASSRVHVAMSPSASGRITDRFTIAADGVVSARRALEYGPLDPDFRIPVVASDGGSPALSASATVFVRVTDVNDHAPLIEVSSGEGPLLVTENCPPGTYVARVTASDRDYDANGRVACDLAKETLFSLEPLPTLDRRRHYKLVTAPLAVFDREARDTHDLVLVCRDGGSPPLSATRGVRVLVRDENDNGPEFLRPLMRANISENRPPGTRVTTLRATDRDAGANGQTGYRLTGPSAALFQVDAHSGLVTSASDFDRERTATITLTATAFDRLRPELRANVTVIVTVLDENDNPPRFSGGLSFRVRENTEGVVGRLRAVDDDEGRNGEVDYFLVATSDTFVVSRSGEILVPRRSALDREKTEQYSLEVGARDRGYNPQTATAVVDIVVEDVNDNVPVFLQPSPGLKVNVSVTTLPGTRIFTVEATDLDLGSNAKILFSISPNVFFVINSSDGVIFLNRSLANEVYRPQGLLIRATDGGSPPLTSSTSLFLRYVDKGVVSPTLPDKRTDPRSHSSRDLVLSLSIGMILLIFICLMIFVSYFCVSIFLQKGRDQTNRAINGTGGRGARSSRWLGLCLQNSYGDQEGQDLAVTDNDCRNGTLVRGVTINAPLDMDQPYEGRFNRIEQLRVEHDPLYCYREFTLKPNVNEVDQSPCIYDRVGTHPYWQYSTLGRPAAPHHPPEHTPGPYHLGRHSRPDIVHSTSSDEVRGIVYGDLGPPRRGFGDGDVEKPAYSLASVEMLCHQNDDLDGGGSVARFAGYVVGSPCYANSFV